MAADTWANISLDTRWWGSAHVWLGEYGGTSAGRYKKRKGLNRNVVPYAKLINLRIRLDPVYHQARKVNLGESFTTWACARRWLAVVTVCGSKSSISDVTRSSVKDPQMPATKWFSSEKGSNPEQTMRATDITVYCKFIVVTLDTFIGSVGTK